MSADETFVQSHHIMCALLVGCRNGRGFFDGAVHSCGRPLRPDRLRGQPGVRVSTSCSSNALVNLSLFDVFLLWLAQLHLD